MMNAFGEKKKAVNLIFLLGFLAIILSVNFLHTEKTMAGSDKCPACHFQNSTLTTSQIHFFSLPPLQPTLIFVSTPSFYYNGLFFPEPSNRSPPQA